MCYEERKEKYLKRFGPHEEDPPMGYDSDSDFDYQQQQHRHLLIVTERNWSQWWLLVWSNGPLLGIHLWWCPLKTKIEKGVVDVVVVVLIFQRLKWKKCGSILGDEGLF